MKLKETLLCGLVLFGFVACNDTSSPDYQNEYRPISLTRSEAEVATKSCNFGINLFSKLNEMEEDNILLSPLNAMSAIGMFANGCAGESLNQVLTGLDINSLEDLNTLSAKIMTQFPTADKRTELLLANSLWLDGKRNLIVNPDFSKSLADYFKAETKTVSDISSSKTQSEINNWVSNNTKGLITNWLPQPFDGETVSVLISTLYFKGAWRDKYFKNNTDKFKFHIDNKEWKEVPSMKANSELNGYFDDSFASVTIPYGNTTYTMVIVLPDEGKTIADCIAGIKSESFQNYLRCRGGSERVFKITMPKFDLRGDIDLEESLKALGMTDIWNPNLCNFPGIKSERNIFVKEIKQGVSLSVDETGTKLASTTHVVSGELMAAPPPGEYTMIVDRPFIMMIIERSTGLPLLLARINRL